MPRRPRSPRRLWHATRRFLAQDVWSAEVVGVPTLRRWLYKLVRVVVLAAKGVEENKLLMRSGSLTFITVLSIVPLLAFSFSVAKGLGAYQRLQDDIIKPFLDRTLGGDGATATGGNEVRASIDHLLGIVDGTDVSKLGGLGLAILLYTVLKLLSSIERSFNDIWGVHRSRTFVRRVADYLSICVVVPVLLMAATAVSASVQSPAVVEILRERLGLGALVEVYAKFSSLAAVWVGFSFVYLFMPNTRVRVFSALLGGVVGGTMWHLAQVLHVRFQVGVANYNAIYSTFAALPIFLFWVYTSWCTVLFGAEVAYAIQSEPAYHQLRRARDHDRGFLESLALRVCTRVTLRFLAAQEPACVGQLAAELQVPEGSLEEVVFPMTEAGILVRAEEIDEDNALVPGRDPDQVRLQDVLDAVAGRRGVSEDRSTNPIDKAVCAALRRLDDERLESPHNMSLRKLAQRVLDEGEDGIGELTVAPHGA